MTEWRISTRDENGDPLGELSKVSPDSVFTVRHNAAGTFVIEANWDEEGDKFDRKGGVILLRDNSIVMSGFITGWKRSEKKETGSYLRANGFDDFKLLSTRVALPVPGGPPYTANEYDTVTALPIENAIKHYVSYNAGANAIVSRQIPGLTVGLDYSRGIVWTAKARFDKLDELVVSLANIGGLGVNVKNLVFDVFEPNDKSDEIVFGFEYGSLDGYEYEYGQPEANYLYIGGEGEGTLRTFTEMGDAQSILDWRRVEAFYDYARSTDVAELQAAGTDELIQKAGAQTWELVIQDLQGRVPFLDFDLGDKVGIVLEGIKFVATFAEAEISMLPDNGAKVTPVFSMTGIPLRIIESLENRKLLNRSVRRLETR
jgi:hypothetical protein